MEKQNHRSLLDLIVTQALAFRMVNSRSGAMMSSGIVPTIHSGFSRPRPTMYGLRKHSGEVRSLKKRQRRRSHLRSLRG